MKILLKQIDLERQKITEWRDGFMELEKDYFRYYIDFTADEPDFDDSMPWQKDVINYFDIVGDKYKIDVIEMTQLPIEKIYRIIIIGNNFNIKLYYKTKSRTVDVYKKLVKWRFHSVNISKISFIESN